MYTDKVRTYDGLPRWREACKHSVSEYVKGQAYTNGMESSWANFQRGYRGPYCRMSVEFIAEFEERHSDRLADTLDQMAAIVQGIEGKRMRYTELIDHKAA